MDIMLERYLKVAKEAAIAGGYQLRSDFGTVGKVFYKEDRDPVTYADRNAEKIILEVLIQRFPEHNFLSEEAGVRSGREGFYWIVDPLDGTANFLHGLPYFSVSVALCKDNNIIVGVIYQPMTDELYSAVCGYGTYLNEAPLKVSKVALLSESILGTGFGSSFDLRQKQQLLLGRHLQCCGAIRESGSAALGLSNVARGTYDSYCELGLRIWDVAAGILLVKEAGGTVTLPRGLAWESRIDILASNRLLHQMLRSLMDQDEVQGVEM